MFTFKCNGNFNKTLNRLNLLKELKHLPEALEVVADESDNLCPKKSNRLVNSRVVKINGNQATIGYLEDYAIVIHENLNAHHENGEAKFLEKAWQNKKGEFMRRLTE